MSYLTLPGGIPDFSKAVISFWFRIPKESMDACADLADERFTADRDATQTDGFPNNYVMPRLNAIVPLLAFGPMFEGYKIKTTSEQDLTYKKEYKDYIEGTGWYQSSEPETLKTSSGPKYIQQSQILFGPSYIGIRSVWEYDEDGNKTDQLRTYLAVNLQMANNGQGSWIFTRQQSTQSNYTQNSTSTAGNPSMPTEVAWDGEACSRGGLYPGGENITTSKLIDETEFFTAANGPEVFQGFFVPKNEDGNAKPIEPDQWHHVLVAFDLEHTMIAKGTTGSVSQPDCSEGGARPKAVVKLEEIRTVENPCKMWIALDDVNDSNVMGLKPQDGGEENWLYGLGPNDIATPNCMTAAAASNSLNAYSKDWTVHWVLHIHQGNTDFGIPTLTYTPGLVPCASHPIGIPCVAANDLVQSIYRVEMAEFQLFTGVTLDTGIEENRRAFIDDEGKPVAPNKSGGDGPPGSIELLGQRPHIMLHRSGKWKNGKNTGSTGTDDEGEEIPDGQFEPTAKIATYKPDPSLHGPQGET